MLATLVALHDPVRCTAKACVHDVEGFVNAEINKFERGDRPEWARIRGTEREELVLEGICLMFEIHGRYQPCRNGHTQSGWFSGFAAYMLPKKLGDAWHRLNEHHRYVTQQDGTRRWVYLQPAHSLDGLAAGGPDGDNGTDRTEIRVLPPTKWTPVREAARPAA